MHILFSFPFSTFWLASFPARKVSQLISIFHLLRIVSCGCRVLAWWNKKTSLKGHVVFLLKITGCSMYICRWCVIISYQSMCKHCQCSQKKCGECNTSLFNKWYISRLHQRPWPAIDFWMFWSCCAQNHSLTPEPCLQWKVTFYHKSLVLMHMHHMASSGRTHSCSWNLMQWRHGRSVF